MAFSNHRAPGLLGAVLVLGAALVAPARPASAQIVFDGNIVFGNGNLTQAGQWRTDNMTAACPVGFSTQQLAEVSYTENSYADPLLAAAINLGAPVWRPASGSPAYPGQPGHGKSVNVPNDGWFTQTCYVGALDSLAANDWTLGWTYYDSLGIGRTDLDLARPIRILDNLRFAGAYTVGADSNYILRGQVRVLSGGLLTVLPGAQVFGEKSTVGALIIERGGKIDAQGTAADPIVFTSDDGLLGFPQTRGSWGGINLLGRALANCLGTNATAGDDTCFSEGGLIGVYGGNDDADSSGVLRYVRVEYSGREITTDNELNAFTFNAVGDRTVLEYLQAHRCSDDGLEFFGGTARIRHAISTDGTDDGFDTQVGYRGKAQFIVVRTSQDLTPSQSGGAGQAGEKGIESDNYEFGNDNLPRSDYALANFTIVGDRRNGPGGGNGIQLRRGAAGTILNSIVWNHEQQGLRITDAATWNAACAAPFTRPGLSPCSLVGVEPIASGNVFLSRGTPNPFSGSVAIAFTLPADARVRVSLYDANGRKVAQLADRNLAAGPQSIRWDADRALGAGLYFYRVEAGGLVSQGKLVRAQ
jgi:hypothetical protein